MSLTSLLYKVARTAAWGRAISRAAQGNPTALVKRVRNRAIMSVVGPLLRK